MSSLFQENGGWKIQFHGRDGRRRSLRLGRLSERDAESVRRHIDALISASISGQSLARDSAAWVQGVDGLLYDRMSRVGLVEPRETAKLGPFIDRYTQSRSDVKDTTLLTFQRARNHLVEFFGEGRELQTITAGDADEWASWMTGERGLAKNTARKSISIAKQFMTAAIRKRLIESNPLDHLSGFVRSNKDRMRFITRDQGRQVLDACPDREWRLLFSLARFGGLRIPSEVRELRWIDVDWERNRFRIVSSKTEHHENGGVREVPIFPELHTLLRESFEQADDGAEFVLPRLRNHSNPGVQLQRIIRAAGLEPWPKVWQNLRSSRETELVESHPIHVVTAWIGNSARIATEHYLQVRDEDFEKAVQNPVQHVHADDCTRAHDDERHFSEAVESSVLGGNGQGDAVLCETSQNPSNGRYWT